MRYLFMFLIMIISLSAISSQVTSGEMDCHLNQKCLTDRLTSKTWRFIDVSRFYKHLEGREVTYRFTKDWKLVITYNYRYDSGLPPTPELYYYSYAIVKLDYDQFGIRVYEINRLLRAPIRDFAGSEINTKIDNFEYQVLFGDNFLKLVSYGEEPGGDVSYELEFEAI